MSVWKYTRTKESIACRNGIYQWDELFLQFQQYTTNKPAGYITKLFENFRRVHKQSSKSYTIARCDVHGSDVQYIVIKLANETLVRFEATQTNARNVDMELSSEGYNIGKWMDGLREGRYQNELYQSMASPESSPAKERP
jgi:hypothetical protein